jgi:hypothetical protein
MGKAWRGAADWIVLGIGMDMGDRIDNLVTPGATGFSLAGNRA